jgi:hypothetical protein
MQIAVLLIVLVGLGLGACAAPTANMGSVNAAAVKTEEIEQGRFLMAAFKKDQERIFQIVSPLFRAAADLCTSSKVGPSLGLHSLSNIGAWDKPRRAAAAEFGITDMPTFTYVDANGPLGRAGVMAGDELLGINGKTYAPSQRGLVNARADVMKLSPGIQELKIRRRGQEKIVSVTPERLPLLAVYYHSLSSEVNAYADGASLNVMRGLLRTMSSDDALAMVLAHELAHNCENHIEAKKTNAALGSVLDVLAAAAGADSGGGFREIGASAYSQDFEREADYVGFYYMARSDRSLSEAVTMYRILTAESGGGLTAAYGSSHPSNPERFVRLQTVTKEIDAKKASGQALVPDRVAR